MWFRNLTDKMISRKIARVQRFNLFFFATWRLGVRFITGWRFECQMVGIALILLVGAPKGGAEPYLVVTYDYYGIRGKSAAALRQQMDRLGTVWTDGNTYDAYTRWTVDWQYRYRQLASGCAIASVTTRVAVTYRLPEWIDRDQGTPELRMKWDTYMRALKTHEAGHKNFGLSAAREIEASLLNVGPARTCEDLGRQANQKARRIIDKYVKEEKAYDVRTRFGATQGAVFP
jgi:predicted secreted Zn-dependent protease